MPLEIATPNTYSIAYFTQRANGTSIYKGSWYISIQIQIVHKFCFLSLSAADNSHEVIGKWFPQSNSNNNTSGLFTANSNSCKSNTTCS